VLCKLKDRTNEPHTVQWYEDMFSESGAGKGGAFDYWKDMSYGKLDLTGTVVKGWYEMPYTVAEWVALVGSKTATFDPRPKELNACASQAVGDIDFSKFAGVIALTNAADGQEDLFGGGPPTTIAGTSYPALGGMLAPEDAQFNGILHESAHLFRIDHSRTLSPQPGQDDYGDPYDIGSCLGCIGTKGFGWGDNDTAGPGMNVVQLDTAGWIDADRKLTDFSNSSCNQRTAQLAAVNRPGAAGYLGAQIPTAIAISGIKRSTTTDHYAVELRERSSWDAGIGGSRVLIHLHGQDGYSYWVDSSGIAGTYYAANRVNWPNGQGPYLIAGEEYVDAANSAYVAVNRIDVAAHTATLTLGACKIDATLRYTGATAGDFGDPVTLAADLTVEGSDAPVPNAAVNLSLGDQSCSATTNASGRAACAVTIDQAPGTVTAGGAFAGEAAYNSSTTSGAFTITKQESRVTYDGALTSDYHDAFTASATLVSPDDAKPIAGRTVTFALGSGDACIDTTDSAGLASCEITPTQAAGTVSMVTSFAGDTYYEKSTDTDTFEITKQETTTTYTGRTVILQGASGATLSALLLEEGDPTVPIAGRTLTLSLGGQSCTATTGTDGEARCTLTFNGALGTQPLEARFAGDAYYLESADTGRTAIVFAFPSRGAFTLGDRTVAAASPTTAVTWWSDQWSTRNSVSAGEAPSAFKGFARTVSSLPTSTPPARCSGTWTTSGGNSPPPTSGVPSYMGVLVPSSVKKSGTTISGNFAKIVVVAVDPGYAPSPSTPGTGRIVATYCP